MVKDKKEFNPISMDTYNQFLRGQRLKYIQKSGIEIRIKFNTHLIVS
jgi:hypothetical protein